MSDVYHFFNCQCCLLLKNKCLQFRLATFPQKRPTVLNTISVSLCAVEADLECPFFNTETETKIHIIMSCVL